MSGAHRSTAGGHRSNRKNGAHRVAPKPSRQPYNWLGVGAVTLGLGAAMASGTGIASAKGGSGSSGSTSTSSTDHSNSPSHSTASSSKGHKHTKKSKTTDTGAATAATSATSTGTTGSSPSSNAAAGDDSAADAHDAATAGRHAAKARKAKSAADDQSTTKTKAKAKSKTKTTTTDGSDNSAGTDSDGTGTNPAAAATATPAAATSKVSTKTVSLAATSVSATSAAGTDTTSTTTTTTTTAHATSSNPIVAAIQTAVITFFTNAETIAQLAANGLTGPTAPSSVLNPVGAFLYGIFRGIEDFAGLVPHAGTATTTSDPVTGTVTGNLNFTEPAGAEMSYTVASNPLFGSVTVNTDGSYSYKSNIFGAALAALGLNPTDSFTVTASTGVASTNVTVKVPVTAANDTPSTPISVNQHVDATTGVVTGTLSSTAPDGQPVTYAVFTPTVQGSLTVDDAGNFTYTPTDLARVAAIATSITGLNVDAFTVLATSSSGSVSMPGIITVPIEPATSATPSTPTATNVVANSVTGVVTGTITATDPGGQPLTYNVFTGTVLGDVSINSSTGEFTYTPSTAARVAANPILGVSVVNTDAFTVTASNGSYSSTAIITVPIAPAVGNTPSTPSATNLSTNTDTGVVTGTFTSTSPDGSALTYTVLHVPTQGSITVSGNTFTYTPSTLAQLEASLGLTTDTFGVIATNAAGISSGLGTVTVTVTPIANVLDFPSSPTDTNRNANSISGVVTGTVSATDPAGAPLTYHVLTGPAFGTLTLDAATGNYTYTPTNTARTAANPILGISVVNTDGFTVYATNGTYSSVLPTLVTVPIAPAVNDTPSDISYTKSQNIYSGVVTGTLSSTSPDGSAITYAVSPNLLGNDTSTNSSVTLSTANGVTTYTYTPTKSARENAEGILSGGLGITSDSFTITATNTAGLSNSTTISVPISPASNNTPSDVGATKNQNLITGVITGTLTATSPDGSAITYAVSPNLLGNDTTTNSSITLSTVNGVTTYTYTPTPSARVNAQPLLSGGLGINTDSFTITATNAAGFSNSTTITVPISPSSNDTPSGSLVSHTSSNHVTTGTITGSSPDGTAVTYSAAIKFGSLGSVSINPTTGAYTINSAQVIFYVGGTVTFTVTNTSGFSYDFDYSFPA